jgi:hypothetical protein
MLFGGFADRVAVEDKSMHLSEVGYETGSSLRKIFPFRVRQLLTKRETKSGRISGNPKSTSVRLFGS